MKIKNIVFKFFALIMLISLNACFEDQGTDILMSEEIISFSSPDVQIREPDRSGSVPLEVSFTQDTELTIGYEVTAVNAIEGIDFEILSQNPIAIPPGTHSVDLEFSVTDNDAFEPDARSFTITITSVSNPEIAVNANKEVKITIVNDDCPANTSIWFGNVTVDDVGFSSDVGTGSADSEGTCNILVVSGNFIGATAPVTFVLTPSAPGATEGSIVAERQLYDCCAPAYEYEASGTYDETTGIIEVDYSFYRADGSLWFTGTNTIVAS